MRLIYLKDSLEISREQGYGDLLAMWDILGSTDPRFPNRSTITLETVQASRKNRP